jgi:HTH-type transcriptional regulator/antitoxin HigA
LTKTPDCLLTIWGSGTKVESVNILGSEFKTPGQLIQALLDSRGWTQRVLAIVLDTDETGLNKIVSGKRSVDADLALSLSQIFDVPAEQILELQKEYDLALARLLARPDPKLATRAALFGDLPISDMVKRGWLPGITGVRDKNLEGALCQFFGAQSVGEIEIMPHAAKKTGTSIEATPAQLAWLYRVRQLAEDLPSPRYTRSALISAISKLKPLLISPDGVGKVPRIMMECGVRFVIVESLPSAKIDGVCFWVGKDNNSPVIGMSLRFDRIDNFWFVLRHEIEHVLCEHGRSSAMLDTELEKDRSGASVELPEEERIANAAAADFCVPQDRLQNFIARKAPMFTERDIRGFAATLQTHPGIVAGQLQRHTNRYDLFRNHLVPVRSIVTPNSNYDGWGDVAPIGA